ncbi:hypothetical protein PbJCM13498_25800 [Prolixibacter bellariivorans]|uniref:DUF2971 domain-containing protein n=2 Tax=Prolixibacter bellariivorans TaxID=314319 RepID=A0A5M4B255_9BACT|nr:hypothetical protein PbJCM13498_25800 [Prolixibacter bellariivorans]
MIRNFLNMTEKMKDRPIYRVFSVNRLHEIFDEKKLTLVRPKLWDDPFENFIMNSTGELKDGRYFTIDFRNNFYAQCWTYTRESDAIWRIYSPNKDGVRVTTTPRKLLKALYDQQDKFRDLHCFVGKVQYYTTKGLKNLLTDSNTMSSWLLDSTGAGHAQTLLFKRTPFKHENEVRLIYNSNGKTNGDLYKFDIDPYDLFDDIVFDPRMKYDNFKQEKEKLKLVGFKKRIVKSNLYKTPSLTFKIDK